MLRFLFAVIVVSVGIVFLGISSTLPVPITVQAWALIAAAVASVLFLLALGWRFMSLLETRIGESIDARDRRIARYTAEEIASRGGVVPSDPATVPERSPAA